MKKLALLNIILLISVSLMAQSTADLQLISPLPDASLLDNLNAMCAVNKVKTISRYEFEYGQTVLKSVTTFNAQGKPVSEINADNYFNKYYTYSGDTTIVRIISPDGGYNGTGSGPIVVTVEKYNSKKQLLVSYWGKFDNWADSVKTPPIGYYIKYQGDKMQSITQMSGGGETFTYDDRGSLIKHTANDIDKYRRIYEKDKLVTTYYTENDGAEMLFEKYSWNPNGSLATYEYYNKSGKVSGSYNYTYDANNRVIAEKGKCYGDVFIYNTNGTLAKIESYGCDKSTSSTTYEYNAKQLPVSITSTGSNGRTTTYTYSFF